MTVIQEGAVNTASIIVPNVYVQILSPKIAFLNGVPTNILGIVGSAEWGPMNSPATVASMADFDRMFGKIQTTAHDLGTNVAIAVMQGANNMRCVRVTDGTDAKAEVDIVDTTSPTPVTGMTVTAKYSGKVGNKISVIIGAGSNSTLTTVTYKLTIIRENYLPEIYDNIGGTGLTLWQNFVNAINLGLSSRRGPSELVVATIGTSTATPAQQSYSLVGGLNGDSNLTTANLIGSDTSPRTGMYALRNINCNIAFLAGVTDSTSWLTQASFGLSEGIYMILAGAAGQHLTIDDAISAKKTAGLSSYAAKLMLGDWHYFNDVENNQVRLVSPQAAAASVLATTSPAESSLNKQIYGIIGTQSTYENRIYSDAEVEKLVSNGIDVVTNPAPGGAYFACRTGHNSSYDQVIWGDNYTRMTNYLAYTFNAGMGSFIGKTITTELWEKAIATLSSFLQRLANATPPLIGDPTGAIPYSVQIDAANNPPSVVAQGRMIANVKVRYLAINEVFLINLEGSQSTVVRSSTQPTV